MPNFSFDKNSIKQEKVNVPNALVPVINEIKTEPAPALLDFNTELSGIGPSCLSELKDLFSSIEECDAIKYQILVNKFGINSRGEKFFSKLQASIEELWAPYDKRNPDRVIYKSGVVVLVFLFAKMCGAHTCMAVHDFWKAKNALLQLVIKDMPAPKYKISAETLRVICSIPHPGTMEKLLKSWFSHLLIPPEKLLQNQHYDTHFQIFENNVWRYMRYRFTVGGDGQELHATYLKGDPSKHKNYTCVSLFLCDARIAMDYMIVCQKNHECSAIIKMLKALNIDTQFIFCADALNNTASLRSCLKELEIDYILPLKTNNGLGNLYDKVDKAFTEQSNLIVFTKPLVIKKHGRFEQYEINIIPAWQITKERDAGCFIQVKHCGFRYINGCPPREIPAKCVKFRYYETSLGPNAVNYAQICHSIGIRWLYEEHHHMLDTVMMQDNHNMHNPGHIDFACGINKIVYNLMAFFRQPLSPCEGSPSRPISFWRVFALCAGEPILAIWALIKYLECAAMHAPVPVPETG